MGQTIRYAILDPTGNLTALVESPVPPHRQPAAAARIMARHPAVEQVGFLTLPSGQTGVHAALRMAGGEFCGNASLCAAALYRLRQGGGSGAPETISLRVSGAADLVQVRLQAETEAGFRASVRMPPALGIQGQVLTFGSHTEPLPLVRMEGISHLILTPDTPFFALRTQRRQAEAAVRVWCGQLGAGGLGLMFLEGSGSVRQMTPLVYIPDSGTLFWENSCASGSAAAGRYLAAQRGAPVDLTLVQPGGSLRVESRPDTGETWLSGTARLVREEEMAWEAPEEGPDI